MTITNTKLFTPKAVIFDMDGLLIDSEPYWKIAEKKVFGELGLDLSDELLRQVMGFRLSEVVKHWHTYQPWAEPDFAKTEQDVLAEVRTLIIEHADPLQGVGEVIRFFSESKIPMAVASSSPLSLVEAVMEKLKLRNYFDVLWSAGFEPYGKPHPGIFLSTASRLNVDPLDCLVFEDSINGVIAAKAARMHCVAIPEEATFNDPRFAVADQKFRNLGEFLMSFKSAL